MAANVINLANTNFFFKGIGESTERSSESWRVMEPHEYIHPVWEPKGC